MNSGTKKGEKSAKQTKPKILADRGKINVKVTKKYWQMAYRSKKVVFGAIHRPLNTGIGFVSRPDGSEILLAQRKKKKCSAINWFLNALHGRQEIGDGPSEDEAAAQQDQHASRHDHLPVLADSGVTPPPRLGRRLAAIGAAAPGTALDEGGTVQGGGLHTAKNIQRQNAVFVKCHQTGIKSFEELPQKEPIVHGRSCRLTP